MKLRLLCLLLAVIAVLDSCTSGKSAYKHGDYYDAVLQAVQRLRSSPENKKSKEILGLSYQPAVDFLTTDAQNQISSNANMKWKAVVADYNKINTLYENIRTSPGALKVVSNPVNKYKELTIAKDSAAAECYNRGIEAMLKNTREDAKQAFFLFTDANAFSPNYRESIEMLTQAKFNATLKVVVQPGFQNNTPWNFDPIIYGINVNQFVRFYTPQQVQSENLQRVDQYVQVSVGGYNENQPTISRNSQNYTDSVTNGEKTVGGRKVPNRQLVSGQATIYEKSMTGSGSVQLVVREASSSNQLMNPTLTSRPVWSVKWASCSGDQRAIPKATRDLCGRAETYPQYGQLMSQAKSDLDNQLATTLNNFYRNY